MRTGAGLAAFAFLATSVGAWQVRISFSMEEKNLGRGWTMIRFFPSSLFVSSSTWHYGHLMAQYAYLPYVSNCFIPLFYGT